ncbi:hypothetical protein OG301_39200 (plasmid) [Streptomyces platensis]|uniref:hypothetical protein n=1 Tax=Streptomyces platensis TaxID=58346 RepID=UPI002ED19DA2|nr:hypothetical protein OG301_39200 [Streptomyces platensis]
MENPYGGPAQATKPGLTRRGKVALGIGATVIAGGGLIGYQVHSANEVKAQEIALKAQTLELQKMKWQSQVNKANKKAKQSQAETRQASIDTCVKSQADQVGKVLGTTYRDVVDACQTQYPDTATGGDMEAAGASQTANDSSSGGVNQGLLVGGGALVLFLVYAAKKGTRSNPA